MTGFPGRYILRRLSAFVFAAGLIFFSNLIYAIDNKEVNEDGLVGDFYYNQTAKHQRPVIIFGGSGGGYFLTREERGEFAKPLIEKGYAVLFLVYFDYKGKGNVPKSLLRIPLEYFATAMTWVGRQPGVRSDSVAIYGSSRGGELALLLAVIFQRDRSGIRQLCEFINEEGPIIAN